jgi:hypothetical protein
MTQVYVGETLNVVCVALTAAAVAGTVGALTDGDRWASFGAGIAVLLFPHALFLLKLGTRSAPFAVAATSLALWALVSGRGLVAVALATLAGGFWQVGCVGFAVVVADALRRGYRPAAVFAVAGVVTGVGVAPFALRDALVPMVNVVLFGPLVKGETGGPVQHLRELLALTKQAFTLWLLAGVASLRHLDESVSWRRATRPRLDPTDGWWVPAGTAAVGLWVLVIDLDGAVDVFMLNAFAAVCVGTALARLSRRQRIVAVVVTGLLIAMLWFPHRGWILTPLDVGFAPTGYHEHLLSRTVPPESCHMRVGYGEREWMRRTGETTETLECGRTLPFDLP